MSVLVWSLDGHLGSILQESLGGTAAEGIGIIFTVDDLESLSLFGSGAGWLLVVAECTLSLSWEVGFSAVILRDLSLNGCEACIVCEFVGISGLSNSESSNLACSSSGLQSLSGGDDGSLSSHIGGESEIVGSLQWLQDIGGPVPSFVMELLLFSN